MTYPNHVRGDSISASATSFLERASDEKAITRNDERSPMGGPFERSDARVTVRSTFRGRTRSDAGVRLGEERSVAWGIAVDGTDSVGSVDDHLIEQWLESKSTKVGSTSATRWSIADAHAPLSFELVWKN